MNDSQWKIDIRTLIAVAAVIIAAIQALAEYTAYREDRPNLALRVEQVVLSSGLDPEMLTGALLEARQSYPVVSHYFVENIREKIAALNEEDEQYRRDLADVIAEIQRAETFYSGPARRWDRNETTYENGVIAWPDRFRLDLTRVPDFLLPDVFSADVVEAVRASVRGGRELDDTTLDRLLEQAVRWDDPSADEEIERRAVRSTLTYVRRQLEQTASDLDHEVVLTVVVENRSRRPNSISRGFLIVGDYRDGEIDMRLRSDDTRVDGYDSRTLARIIHEGS